MLVIAIAIAIAVAVAVAIAVAIGIAVRIRIAVGIRVGTGIAVGTLRGDHIFGVDDDTIPGGSGDDIMVGPDLGGLSGVADTLYGGSENDTLYGGTEADAAYARACDRA